MKCHDALPLVLSLFAVGVSSPAGSVPTLSAQNFVAFSQAGSEVCGSFLAYAWNAQRTEVLVIEAEQRLLQLDRDEKTFDLDRLEDTLRVHRDVYEKSQERFDYCSDLKAPRSEEPAVWRPRSGHITIGVNDRANGPRMTIRFDNAGFQAPNGALITFPGSILIAAASSKNPIP